MRQISTGGEDAVVVKAVIIIDSEPYAESRCRGRGNTAELNFLRAHHCDVAQAYYFRRPAPAEQFLDGYLMAFLATAYPY